MSKLFRYTAPVTADVGSLSAPAASAVVLAGGKGSRLGADKALLLLAGQPLIARTVQQLSTLSDDLIVVTNSPERYEPLGLAARLVTDERPDEGSLMGIYSGLKAARHACALVVACDMPFLNPPLLHYLLSIMPDYDVVVPRLAGMLEPLHAVYGRTCLPWMARLLQEGRRRIVAFFPCVKVRHVEEGEIDVFDPLHLSFVNINTPQDWEQVQGLLSTHNSSPQ
jgi:molybdopterin-guanine dinucleotide biosynthesis protein A